MSKLTRWTMGCVIPLCFAIAGALHADTSQSQSENRLKTYRDVDGQVYFVLNVRSGVEEANQTSQQRDLLILVDTSASQTGRFRTDSLDAVETIVGNLQSNERVYLAAIDLQVVSMTDGFVGAKDAQFQSALAKLQQRTPLGATDMLSGLEAALEMFEDNDHVRSILYIGDGMSRANLISQDELEPLVQQIIRKQVSINSYAIGHQRDMESLAVLANNSGGSIYVDGTNVTAQQAGMSCLQLARSTVVWPTEVDLPESVTEIFPAQMPPLRQDRDTVLIGSMVNAESMAIQATCQVAGKSTVLRWNLTAQDASKNHDFAMLPDLVSSARPNDGLTMTLLGQEGFDLARRGYQQSSEQLSRLGKQAISRGDTEGGVGLLREALRRDPGNLEAKTLLKSTASVRAVSTTKGIARPEPQIRLAQADDDDPFGDVLEADDGFGADVLPDQPTEVPADLITEPADAPQEQPAVQPRATEPAPVVDYGYDRGGFSAEPLNLGSAEQQSDSDLLMSAEEERELQEAILRTEVKNTVAAGRELMRKDPAGVIDDLKNLRESIQQSPDISTGARAELMDRLEQALRQASRARIEKDRLDENARANVAELTARRQILDASIRQREKVQQYMDQVKALLDEGRFQLAEEVALEMREEAPRMVAPQVAVMRSGYSGNYRRMREIHELNGRRFLDALYEVEKSHIPFPDNPPIAYPDADVWEQLTETRKARYSKFDLGETGPAERRISAALQEMTELEVSQEPLANVVAIIEEQHNIPIKFKLKALEDDSVDPSSDTVDLDVSNISLRSALRLMLDQLELTYVIENEVLMITTQTDAEETLVTKVYPVGDLVMPLNSMMMMGGGMMGGGMMGGMGGGMMGGMGGMGGGMGGGMFDVDDTLQLGAPRPAKSAATVPTKAEDGNVENAKVVAKAIRVTQRAGESLDAAWDRYFGQLAEAQLTTDQERQVFADVRETIRQLAAKKEFATTIVVIEAALRNGQYQPWMHQTLALAMRATGAPQADIERAFMSMIDLSKHSSEMVLVAVQLSRLGMDARAMQLYRDIAASNPLRPEPYIHALDAAKRLGDQDGIRWACENILAQAWPEKQQKHFDRAVLAAKATLVDLIADGRQEQADALAQVLNTALARDVVVRVTWTGDADIDLLVEEPSGTVCSARNARTTSGGVLLGDALPDIPSEQTIEGTTETYVCPQGFNGEYRVLVKRIWGDVAAGKVNVEIATNVTTDGEGTKAGRVIQQQVDLRDKDAILVFQLENGRRQESVEDHIVANAAVRHIEANRTVLAQQFDRLEDDRVAASSSLSDLTFLRTRDPRQAARVEAALRGRGAVGFMPQLTVLPEGTMLMGQAVISADRRYVRVSMMPNFSRVAEVQTFNFATGQGNVQQQNQGGAGGGGGAFAGGGFGGGFQ